MTEAILQRRVNQLLNAYLAAPGPVTFACWRHAITELHALRGE